tara:strand:+ start:299 stop:697 length:399 start_codon:yes stop_codon:yes gene_type:complete
MSSDAGMLSFPQKASLSRTQRSWLDLAVKIAETSEGEHKHGAVIVKGGRVKGVGVNKWRNRDVRIVPDEEYNPHVTVHAEIMALSRAGEVHGATVYVARVAKNGEERYSRPCERCEKELLRSGVKRVIYTLS